jgi:hypothetical protein
VSSGPPGASRPARPPAQRYRLGIDESDDHRFDRLEEPTHRFLFLLGCRFEPRKRAPFHSLLEDLSGNQDDRHKGKEPAHERADQYVLADLVRRQALGIGGTRPRRTGGP